MKSLKQILDQIVSVGNQTNIISNQIIFSFPLFSYLFLIKSHSFFIFSKIHLFLFTQKKYQNIKDPSFFVSSKVINKK